MLCIALVDGRSLDRFATGWIYHGGRAQCISRGNIRHRIAMFREPKSCQQQQRMK
jgi:hypothetical protein